MHFWIISNAPLLVTQVAPCQKKRYWPLPAFKVRRHPQPLKILLPCRHYYYVYFNCLLFDFLTNRVIVSVFTTQPTCWSKHNESATSLLLLSLAIADTGVLVTDAIMVCPLVFCPYMEVCNKYMKFLFHWMTTYFLPVASTCHLFSTWLITLLKAPLHKS